MNSESPLRPVESPVPTPELVTNDTSADVNAFEEAALTSQPSFVTELFAYLKANKKWWQLPIVIVLLALAALLILGGTGAAPFIYTLF